MNRKKTWYNIIFGFGSQIIIIALGLVVPRIVLTHYGSDTNGLTSTVTQIFTYMALLEAGIGQAARNALYAPVKANDKNGISYIMSVARRYYRKITVYYGIGVLVLSGILPLIIKSKINYWTIFLVVFFEGMSQVVNFWYTENWMQLLMAEGENYIKVNADFLGRVAGYSIKIVLAIMGINIAFIQLGYFLVSLVKLSYYKWYMEKNYGWVDYDVAPEDATLPDRNSYIITEIAWTIFSSTDMIILSMFCSTELASVYAIYNMVFTNINTLLNSVYWGTNFLLGQAYYESKEKYCKIHDAFNSIYIGTMTALMCITYILIIPFVQLYTSGVTDVKYVYELLPVGFCLVQILSWSRYVGGNLTGIAGYAKIISKISLVEAIINVVGSFALVWKFQILGVIAATVIALPIKVIYVTWLTEKKILCRSCRKTLKILGVNYLLFIITVIVKGMIKFEINSYMDFIKWGIVLTPIIFIISIICNALVNPEFIKIIFQKKLKKIVYKTY